MLDIGPDTRLIQANGAHTVATRPETAAKKRSFRFQDVPVQPHSTLAFQKTNRMRKAILRWNTQQHVDVVRHRLPLKKFDTALATEISQDIPQLTANLTIQDFTPIFRDDDHMILAFPFDMCLTLPILHLRSSLGPRGLPQWEDRLAFSRRKRQSLINSHRQSRWFNDSIRV